MDSILPYISIIVGILSSFITVKISIAEQKKDISHLKEKLESEISSKLKMETDHAKHMEEMRDDVKAIFRTLTKIQVDMAKSQGNSEVLNAVKDAVTTLVRR